MKIIARPYIALILLGLDSRNNKQGYKKFVKWFWFTALFYTVIPQFSYIFMNRSQLVKAILVVAPVISSLANCIKYIILIIHEDHIANLITILEDFIKNASNKNMNISPFIGAEQKLTLFSKTFQYLVLICLVLYVTVPGSLQFYAYLTDTSTNDTYTDPFFNYYFFDSSYTPVYQICYVLGAFSATTLAIVIPAIDMQFCGFCLFSVALYDYLKISINEIDKHFIKDTETKRKNRIINCIYLHNDILKFIDELNTIYSTFIFVQFACSLIALIANIFQSTLVDVSQIATIVFFCIGFNFQLLIYCWSGSLVFDEDKLLRNAIYNTNWYNYSPKERKMLQMMMIRTMKPRGLSGINYFECNVENFMKITNSAFSALAVLQNIQ